MSELTRLELSGSIAKEFSTDSEGKGFVSRRGLARLCGVRHGYWGRGGSKYTVVIDECLAESGLIVAADTTISPVPEEYYEHLSRLTGLVIEGAAKPGYFAALTKEFVYDYLPAGIYTEIKRCKEVTGSWDKLHQFLSPDGIDILQAHQRKVLHHMQGAASLGQLRTALTQACQNQYQLVLPESPEKP